MRLLSRPSAPIRFKRVDAVAEMLRGQMRIPHRHPNIAVACEGSDFRQRDTRLNQTTDKRVTESVEAHVAQAGLGRRTL